MTCLFYIGRLCFVFQDNRNKRQYGWGVIFIEHDHVRPSVSYCLLNSDALYGFTKILPWYLTEKETKRQGGRMPQLPSNFSDT